MISCGSEKREQDPELQKLYSELDRVIDRSHEYELLKEHRIDSLRTILASAAIDEDEKTNLINSLIDEFNAYNADSTLAYINMNLSRPQVREIPGQHTLLTIRRADVLGHAGLFLDALSAMEKIPKDSVKGEIMEAYYSTYCAIWQYLSEYANEHETATKYELKRSLYADSVRQVADLESFNHFVYVMAELARNGDPDTAIKALESNLAQYRSGMREYSIIASTLAYIYKTAGRTDDYKRFIVMSAISDTEGAVKENMSFREMATLMFEEGDVERANRYLKKSIADANFYSAMMRNAQSSKMLPVIDDAYSTVQKELNDRRKVMVWISGVLSFILLLTVVLLLVQFRSLRKAKDKVTAANHELSTLSDRLRIANEQMKKNNNELSELSEELKTANSELADKNLELSEYNRTKEQYAGLFMEYCSSAISSLQHYQQTLRILAFQGGNRATILKKLESTEMADQLLKNFYVRFDEAILNIYPSFVEKFNALLQPGQEITLKSGELLNRELRLFALIRLGIDDSGKIANFLRCSVATVYTYRSKMKKRAIRPECFEQDVRTIG